MATFTMTLKEAMEFQPDIGLSHYPIFDEAYRDKLNQKIIDRFYNQEIGQETIEMFRLAVSRKMNEIMPLFNQRYISEKIKFDPLDTVDMETFTDNKATGRSVDKSTSDTDTDTTGDQTTGSTAGAKSRAVQSETPQTRLAGDGDYATAAQDNTSETATTGRSEDETSSQVRGKGTGESDTEQDSQGKSNTKGFQGNRTLLLMQYRESFLNVDLEILEELERAGLFMLVWDNGDSFTESGFSYGLLGYGFPF